jgi:hypothetical protein
LLSVSEIQKRLRTIFPEGTQHRTFCTREMAARTVFVMLYAGAVEGSGRHVRPDQITRMTNRQAARNSDQQRLAWAAASLRKAKSAIRGRWYAANTREPIRDETLRNGFIPSGAVVARTDVPTTSSAPRYALSGGFAALFDPELAGDALSAAITAWQGANLSAGARARIQLLRRGAVASREGLLVTFPNGETRRLSAGPSSDIAKAVVEQFAPRFLGDAGVIFLSESGNRVVARDEQLARAIGLTILPDKLLPDIVLVDLARAEPLLVVATGGPMSQSRQADLLKLAMEAGFAARHVAFVSAYLDRSRPAFKATVAELAWGSFAWFAAEPDKLIQMHDGATARCRRLIDLV